MFLKKFKSNCERYFNSYSNGCDALKAFNSHGIEYIEINSYNNDGLYIVIRSKKIETNLFTSYDKRYSFYKKITKNNIFRSIIEDSLKGTIIPI